MVTRGGEVGKEELITPEEHLGIVDNVTYEQGLEGGEGFNWCPPEAANLPRLLSSSS